MKRILIALALLFAISAVGRSAHATITMVGGYPCKTYYYTGGAQAGYGNDGYLSITYSSTALWSVPQLMQTWYLLAATSQQVGFLFISTNLAGLVGVKIPY